MQNKKIKLLSIFIVALLMTGLFACLSGNALADPEPTVWVSSVTGKAGETVTFTVSVENNPGISGYGMTLVYDPAKLTYVSAQAGELLVDNFFALRVAADKININSYNSRGASEPGRVLFTFVMKINEGVTDSVLGEEAIKLGYVNQITDVFVFLLSTGDTFLLPTITQPIINIQHVECEHDYVGVVTTFATCVSEGVMTYTCGVCGDSYTEAILIDAENHVGGTYEAVIAEATFDADGLMGIYCSDCNALLDTCVISKLTCEHDYVGVVTTFATCVSEGVMTYTCGVCGDSYTEAILIDAENHVGGTYEAVIAEATFDADGLMGIYCSDCNALLDTCVIPKLVVSLSDDATLLTLLVDGVSVSGFDPLMLSYSIAVPYSVTSVAIVATANDVGAMVSGDGVKVDLVVGANTFDIIVTAEDGSIQVYTLTVTRDIESGPVVTVVSATPTASVKQLSGNQNDLTITVTELLSDGTTNVISQIFRINNNAVDTYTVGPYRVYVDTKGNTQIRACYIVNVEDIDEPVNEPVNVVLSIQLDASGFYLVKQSLTVEANLSERYGYTDAYNGTKVTTLDALVAAHILMFGDENLAYYLDVDSYGTVWMIAGKNAEYSYFFVNGALPDSYTVVDVVLTSGDDLMFYFLQDTYYWSDAMAWFVDYTNDNVSVNSITVEQGEIFDVTLVGYMALWAFYGDVADYTEPIEGAQVVVLDFDDSAGFCSAWFGEELGLTDASGQLSITFNTPGTYILSAYDNSGYDMPFVAPWLVVTVTEKTVLPVDPVVVRTVEELYDALNNPDVTDIIIPSDGIIELTDSVTINSGVTLTIQGMLNLGEMGMISNVGTICNVGGIINNYAGGIIYNSADGVISISDAGTINNYQATINNDGVINNDDGIINNNDAAINNAGGGIITNGDMGLVNNYGGGVINNYDSSVIISSGVVNNYQATINNSEFATFSNDGGLVNNNAAEIINNGGVINNSGIVNNYGAGLVNNCAGGVINNFGAASVINNYQAVINNNEATINNDDGAMFNNNEATILNNAGTIINDGAGMVNNYGAGEILNRNGGIIDNCRAIINNGAVIDNRGGGVLNNDADGAVYTNELGVIYNDDEGQ